MPKYRHTLPAALPQGETIDFDALAASVRSGETRLVVVLGPTASGKTKYAVRLAGELGRRLGRSCEIISADSRQVYRGMDIGTGKDLGEYGGVPYHLIDIADPGEKYNVYRFSEDFRRAFEDISSRGAVPILCGGTGLYINAVTADYDFREHRPLSSEREASRDGVYFIGTLVSREERNRRIDRRLRERLDEGLVEEIRNLLDGGTAAEVLIAYGLEYKHVTEFVLGETTQEEMFVRLSTAIHQFAKRQMTWFRGMERSGVKIHWVEV